MHNGRLVDPLDPIVKKIREVSEKARKTDEDYHEIGHLEWLGGMYYDPSIGPFIPAPNLQKSIVEGARLTKSGKKIERGVFIETIAIPVRYDGTRDVEEMWDSRQFIHRSPVKIGMNRVMRTRPIFAEWRLEAIGQYDNAVINFSDLAKSIENAGNMIGLGDYRPVYGRYNSKVEDLGT
jgi:hypothetical protein